MAETQNNLPALRDSVAKAHAEFKKSLPGHISVDRFVRTAQTAIALTYGIEKANPKSLLLACSKAASDGLILDGREAALVIDFRGDAQYRPMMRGLLKLAYQSGEIRSIVVETVRANDLFLYTPTDGEKPITHGIDLKTPRGEVYAVYAMATLRDGGIVFEVMTLEDVNRIRDRSDAYKAFKAGKIKSTPWSTDWSEMARKTVFRRLSKYLPSSTDRAQQAAERIDEDYSFAIDEPGDEPAKPAQARKPRGGGAAALKNVTPAAKPKEPDDDETPHDPETGEIIDVEHNEPETTAKTKEDDI